MLEVSEAAAGAIHAEAPPRPSTSATSANPSRQVASTSGRSEARDVTAAGGSKDIVNSPLN